MIGPFLTGCLSILLKKNSALVVLVNDVVGHIISIGLQEQPCLQNGRHKVVHTYHLRFGGATGIQLLFSQIQNWITSSHT